MLNMFNTASIGNVLSYTANGMEWKDPDEYGIQEDELVFYEIPSGTINSINTSFNIANSPLVGSVQVFLNGLLQAPGSGLDFTVSGQVITFAKAPHTNSDLYVHYVISE